MGRVVGGNSKSGKRADLNNTYFRSAWEANYARYLNFLMAKGDVCKWEYEPVTFCFEAIKRGTRFYTPDFKVWYRGDESPVYVEVKGYMDKVSATKLKRMAKYYPDIKIEVVGKDEYRQIKTLFYRVIEGWE